jgi:hypothetical protein
MDAHKPKRAKDVLARAHSSAFCPLVNSLTTPALSTSLLPLVLTTKPTNDFTSLPIEVESSQRVPLPSTAQLGLGMGRFGARHSDRRCTVPPVPAEHDKVGRWTAPRFWQVRIRQAASRIQEKAAENQECPRDYASTIVGVDPGRCPPRREKRLHSLWRASDSR